MVGRSIHDHLKKKNIDKIIVTSKKKLNLENFDKVNVYAIRRN